VENPGNLADLRDEAYFSGKLPSRSTGTDKHSASGRVFALKTAGGGVLAFYAAWVETLQVSMYWIRHHTDLGRAELRLRRRRSLRGHEDNRRGSRSMGAMATYVRAGLPEVATALAALTGEPHPLAVEDPAADTPGRLRALTDADA
jgi:hypothetical protein